MDIDLLPFGILDGRALLAVAQICGVRWAAVTGEPESDEAKGSERNIVASGDFPKEAHWAC